MRSNNMQKQLRLQPDSKCNRYSKRGNIVPRVWQAFERLRLNV